MKPIAWVAAALLGGGRDRGMVEVDHSFYLGYFEDLSETALFRCPDEPSGGCSIDRLPGPKVIAAGVHKHFITVAHQRGRNTACYYFARIAQETGGWGNNPERIIGPLTEKQFRSTTARLGLSARDMDP
jgi:hypothetical protein